MFARDVKLPPSFDSDFYRRDKPFLRSPAEARDHFVTIGKGEGLKGSPGCDQGYLLRFIRGLHPEKMLEIGPGCAPKLKGKNVRYFDVKSKEELQDRYKNDPGFAQIPEEIHYVDKAGSLKNIGERFDVVFSSHVIEHAIDLVAHLKEVETLLEENGLYVVVVPNKNFTFDFFKPVSVIEDVVTKHLSPIKTLSLRSVLLEANRRTHNSAARHWANDHGQISLNKEGIRKSIAQFEKTAANGVAASGYHNWIFTEEAFVEIINGLYELELTSLKVQSSYNTPFGGLSFSAVLRREA
jgi:SAM-dependent methyltransferase